MDGWIKLYRKVRDSKMMQPTPKQPLCRFGAWVDLLLRASYRDNEYYGMKVERGQIATSMLQLSKSWKWSEGKVKRFLKALEKCRKIDRKTTDHFTIITLCNYDTYQHNENQDDGPTADQQRTNGDSKESKKVRSKETVGVFEKGEKATMPKKPKPEKKPPNPDIKLVIQYFCDAFKKKFGVKYVVDGAKDGALVKRLLGSVPIEEVNRTIDLFFASKDEFITKEAGCSISILSLKFNKLRSTNKTQDTNYDDLF